MVNSTNYLGGGGARIEKPDDYYDRINKPIKNSRTNEAKASDSSNKVNSSSKTKETGPSKFDKILQKNQSSKASSKQYKNTSVMTPMDIKQAQYDAAKKRMSEKVAGEISKKGIAEVLKKDVHSQKKTYKELLAKGEEETGTNLALKQLAIEYEEQIYGIMWNMIFESGDRDYQGGLGEEIFHKELVSEMQKYTNTGEMGPIAKSIYNDMVRNKQSAGR